MTTQVKLGLLFLSAGGFGLWWANKKKTESAEVAPTKEDKVLDVDFEEMPGSTSVTTTSNMKPTESKPLINGSVFNTEVKKAVNIDQGQNTLTRAFDSDSDKTNRIPVDEDDMDEETNGCYVSGGLL